MTICDVSHVELIYSEAIVRLANLSPQGTRIQVRENITGTNLVKLRPISGLTIVFSALCAFAGVTVTQTSGPGATSWPDTPLIQTVTNPSLQVVVGEGFGSGTSIAETFTVPGRN